MSLEAAIEAKIQEAMAAGAFDNLPGAGKPLPVVEGEEFAGDNALGFRVLRNAGLAPSWLMLGREIELDANRLKLLDDRHADTVRLAAASGSWPVYRRALRFYYGACFDLATKLRRKQDNFNLTAPGSRSERPAIWVEKFMARLEDRVLAAGGPPDYANPSL